MGRYLLERACGNCGGDARLHQGGWELTAVAIVLRDDPRIDAEQRLHAQRVLAEIGLMSPTPHGVRPGAGLAQVIAGGAANLASEAAAPVLQCAAILSGSSNWTTQDDQALLAQGRASAQAAPLVKQFVVPALDGLTEFFERSESPTMLDVGVGVAAA